MAEQERRAKRSTESEPEETPAPAASAKLADKGAKIRRALTR
jgi:hypothetical protein